VVAGALYWMYRQPRSITLLLKMVLLTIFAVVFLSQYRSPQYIVWFTPFAALLVAGDHRGILSFYAVQVLAFIEFPLAFWVLYVNQHYVTEWALGFFTLLFIAYGLLLWEAMKGPGIVDGIPEKKVAR